ncbi:hypothetical protein [Xylocopilactobacillus apis]|uniref:Uncharacterized protein n=1 Tax=Xylocopilactobacillus apis TaxID=2932183 RepID=A0AAU9DQA8_9LACO|nr:hypothetical protein [Xylocopilactobacillus apis]BDR55758.1 hypothetical protein KIMC2_03200 [Xylocopilactobacillus apis]
MNYKNIFISQMNLGKFLSFLGEYLLKEYDQKFFFELVFSTNIEDENYEYNFFNKYKKEVKSFQSIGQELLYFEDKTLSNTEFIDDIVHYLEQDGFIILHIFFSIDDLMYLYTNGFEKYFV